MAFCPSLVTLLIAHTVCNIPGNIYTALVIGFAMVSDDTPPALRETAFGLTEAGLYVGVLFGPFAGALLQRWLGYRYAFLFAAVLEGGVVLVCAFFLRESLPAHSLPHLREDRGEVVADRSSHSRSLSHRAVTGEFSSARPWYRHWRAALVPLPAPPAI